MAFPQLREHLQVNPALSRAVSPSEDDRLEGAEGHLPVHKRLTDGKI